MSSRSSDAALVGQPPSMRMPNELLDEVFKQVFAELENDPVRNWIRVYAPLSLVCKAWQRVAVTHVCNTVVVDAAKDSAAIAFLDPVVNCKDKLGKSVQFTVDGLELFQLEHGKPTLREPRISRDILATKIRYHQYNLSVRVVRESK
ncbi:hypothetical protein RHOSPDRAFT_35303 [Rhodotorula sp. JG-1b]|nr:hypothetical protein RHOSPDRAFT_35303 [Rhodotorula sp. JG-1b]